MSDLPRVELGAGIRDDYTPIVVATMRGPRGAIVVMELSLREAMGVAASIQQSVGEAVAAAALAKVGHRHRLPLTEISEAVRALREQFL